MARPGGSRPKYLLTAHMRFTCFSHRITRWAGAAAALAAVCLLSGCVWFDGPQSTFDPAGPVARDQLRIFYVTCWVTLVIFLVVGSVLAYAMIRFRARSDADEHAAPPEQGHGNPMVEVGLIGASIFALVIIAVPTLKGIWYSYDVPEDEKANAYEITATGYQWWFKFEYPGETAQTVDMTGKPASAPLTTGNELVIPAGRAGPPREQAGQPGERAPDDGQRARDPGGAARADQPAHGRCHPQLLDPQARGEGRHDPQPREPPLGRGRQARLLLGAVRRVLRGVPRGHALQGRRDRAREFND